MKSRSPLYKLSRKALYSLLPGIKLNSVLFHCLRIAQTLYYFLKFLKKSNDTRLYRDIIGNSQNLFLFSYRLAASRAFARLWNRMIHIDIVSNSKQCDFSELKILSDLMSENRGLLGLTYHYGPQVYTYLMHSSGISPNLLIGITNLDDIRKEDLMRRPDKEFLATYPKLHLHNSAERSFLKALLNKEAGLIMMDYQSDTTSINTTLFGINYPIGAFPFKIAARYNIPIVILWFSRLKGSDGFKLNVLQLKGDDIEKNAHTYSEILENIVIEDPGFWTTAFECLLIRKTT